MFYGLVVFFYMVCSYGFFYGFPLVSFRIAMGFRWVFFWGFLWTAIGFVWISIGFLIGFPYISGFFFSFWICFGLFICFLWVCFGSRFFVLAGGFYNFDRLRSKDVRIKSLRQHRTCSKVAEQIKPEHSLPLSSIQLALL